MGLSLDECPCHADDKDRGCNSLKCTQEVEADGICSCKAYCKDITGLFANKSKHLKDVPKSKLPADDDIVTVSTKLDGIYTHVDGDGSVISRQNKPLIGFNWLPKGKHTAEHSNVHLYGELYDRSTDFDTLSGRVRSHDETLCGYAVFDCYFEDKPLLNYVDRMKKLTDLQLGYEIVEMKQMTFAEAKTYAAKLIKAGEEGICIRTADDVLKFSTSKERRSNTWIKIKEAVDVDATILEVIQAIDIHGVPKPMAGAFKVEYNGHPSLVSAGAMKEPKKIDAWERREELVGKRIQLTGMKITKKGAIKHGQVERIREDD